MSDCAQVTLTDVVYVDQPPNVKTVKQGEPIGTVESVKAVSEIFAPISGTVVDVNKALVDKTELVNKDPYGDGWMVVLDVTEPAQANALMDSTGYRTHIGD